MRTTLTLDEDALNIARQNAEGEHLSSGTSVSELMQMPAVQRLATRSKYSVLPARNETMTSEHVYKLMEQEGI